MKPVADSGQLALLSNRKDTMAQMFLDRVAATPQREAFRYPAGDQWKSVTWRETDELARRRAAGLIALGVEPEQRVAIASSTRMEWIDCYLAAVLAAAATTTIYPSTMSSDVAFIVADADVQVVFAEDAGQVDKLREHRSETPSLHKVVLIDGTPLESDGDWVISLSALDSLGDAYLAEHAVGGRRAVGADQGGSPLHVDLHLRHHRASEGRAAAALGVDVRGRRGRGDPGAQSGRPAVPVVAVVARVRSGAGRRTVPDRFRDGGRRADRQDCRQCGDRPTDLHGRGAADLREGARADRDDDRVRRWGQGQALRLGVRGRCASLHAAPGRQGAERSCWRRSTPRPIGWCCRRSGLASAGGSGSSCPARPPWTRSWPSGSTPPGC